jgi:hypothetical protein
MQGHHQLFQRRVARPLADAVDGHFHLPRPLLDGLQKVGHRDPQVVVAVDGDDGLLDVGHILADALDQLAEFFRHAVADGVGDVDGFGSRPNGCLDHLVEKLRIGTGGVHHGELHIVHEGLGVGHHLLGNLQHFGAGLAQLVLEVNVGGGDKGVDAGLGGGLEGFGCRFDVGLEGAGQAANHRAIGGAHLFGHLLHRLEVPGAGIGKPSFNDIDPQPGQLPGDGQLFFGVEGGAGALLPVAQGGVENEHVIQGLAIKCGNRRSIHNLCRTTRQCSLF